MEKQTFGERAADVLTNASGSWPTFWVFTAFVVFSLVVNTSILFISYRYDPYPYELLTFILSLFANYQAMFVLISARAMTRRQKEQEARDREQEERDRLTQAQMFELQQNSIHMMEAQSLILEELRQNIIVMADADEDIVEEIEALREHLESKEQVSERS